MKCSVHCTHLAAKTKVVARTSRGPACNWKVSISYDLVILSQLALVNSTSHWPWIWVLTGRGNGPRWDSCGSSIRSALPAMAISHRFKNKACIPNSTFCWWYLCPSLLRLLSCLCLMFPNLTGCKVLSAHSTASIHHSQEWTFPSTSLSTFVRVLNFQILQLPRLSRDLPEQLTP